MCIRDRTGGTLAFQAVVPAMVTDRTRSFLVQAASGYRYDPATTSYPLHRYSERGWPLPDGIDVGICQGNFYLPNDYVSNMTVTAVVEARGTGNVRVSGGAAYGAVGESSATHNDNFASATLAVVNAQINEIWSVNINNANPGDYFSLDFLRDADHIDDTLAADLWFMGWRVTYTADS